MAVLRIWRRGMIIWLLERARVATKITGRQRFCDEEIAILFKENTIDKAKADIARNA